MQLSTSKQEDIDSLLHWMRCDQLLKVPALTFPQLWSVIRNFKWRWVPHTHIQLLFLITATEKRLEHHTHTEPEWEEKLQTARYFQEKLNLPLKPSSQATSELTGFPGEFLQTISVLVLCVPLTQTRVAWEEETSAEEWPPPDGHVGMSMGHFLGWLLMFEGPAHCGGGITRHMALGCLRNT